MVCTISNSNYANMHTSQLYTKKEIIFQIIFLILINYDTTHDNMHYIASLNVFEFLLILFTAPAKLTKQCS